MPPKPQLPAIQDPFSVDYAPTDRACCKTCQATLAKNSIRFGRKVRSPWHDGFDIQYRHFNCGMEYVKHPREITGIMDLQWKHFEKCVKKLTDVNLNDNHPTVREYRLRSEALWELKSKLAELPVASLTPALQLNNIWFQDRIKAPEAAAVIADGLLFGKLPKCPVCDTMALRQSGTDIRCVGYLEGSNVHCRFAYSLADIYDPDCPPDNSGADGVKRSDLQRQEPFFLPPSLQNVPTLRRWKRPSTLPPLSFSQEALKGKKRAVSSCAKSDDETEESVPQGEELAGLEFSSIGSIESGRRELELLVQQHGGVFRDTLTASVSYLLVDDDISAVKETKRFKQALQWGVPVIHRSFVNALVSRVPVYPSKSPNDQEPSRKRVRAPGSWDRSAYPSGLLLRQRKYAKYYLRAGKLPQQPFPTVQHALALRNDSNIKVTSQPSMVKRPPLSPNAAILKVDSWFAGKPQHRVYVDENNNAYNCATLFTDITTGINKFYNQQLLELPASLQTRRRGVADEEVMSPCYWVFRRWGRVGADNRLINDFLSDSFGHDKDAAIAAFRKRCMDLTGIDWDERFTASAKPGRYRYIHLDDEGTTIKAGKPAVKKNIPPCTLDAGVQRLMELIFDRHMMEAALEAQHLDMRKMPLGTISRAQMAEGYRILQAIQNVLIPEETRESPSEEHQEQIKLCPMSLKWKAKITALTGQFYSAIPHSFPLKATPPLLDAVPKLREKILLLEQLMEISVANSIINNAAAEEEDSSIPRHPLDAYYTGLGCELKPLLRESEEFKNITLAIENTHGITHSGFQLQISDIFSFRRDTDITEYRDFVASHDNPKRQLLWHGSRLTNWAGILKLGLRAAPKDAPISGYMFGKGIYFADMVSKAAQYCYASSKSPQGLLVLAEVALGSGLPRLKADARAASACKKEGLLHTWGVGQTTPDRGNDALLSSLADSVSVPLACGRGIAATEQLKAMGEHQASPKTPSLLYNEYIVYDKHQVLIRYIIKVTFQFKTLDDELSSPTTSSNDSSCSSDSD